MPHVLVVGESWFTHSVHQKGFDSFFTSEYVEGAQVFLDALRDRGHTVTYVPAHEIASRVPATAEGLDAYDVVVISDVGANSFQLTPQTFAHSVPAPDRTELLRGYVERGGGLLMVGGYLTFTGIDAKARWGRTPLAAALPVTLHDRDDRVELPAGAAPRVLARHPVVDGLDATWPVLLGLNEVAVRERAELLVECAGHPLLAVGDYGAGRSAAFTSDLAPHWAPPGFLDWQGYPELWDRLVRWLSGTPAETEEQA
ncbi:glutamine amidotransferase [Streptomyces griseorubiginosus]|uniref:glutamine amidotransferase n=1 Tax=Streptomyces griseorubiginosus TaxID=67304 RepID=UPI002E811134|nr:glutamine amidotransferase [Streptomyces griseorubiginosus]WUB47320.1 glutamine amidotransferase [Streptomyces griseorubiginosus]WUB55844.1 glutamine amidotransferase [Streptomyces griseorubiginosus]